MGGRMSEDVNALWHVLRRLFCNPLAIYKLAFLGEA